MLIYLLTNTVNGKVYVGQTIQTLSKRMNGHKGTSKCPKAKGYNDYVHRAIRKYGWDNFKVSIIDNTTNKTQKQLDSNETIWIACFDSANREFGYNIEKGGSGRGKVSDETKKKLSEVNTGKTLSDETKKKLSEANIGKTHSDEAKKKMSEANTGENNPMFGKPHSDKAKKKISKAHTGKTRSDETKKKLSEAKSGENHPMFGKTHSDKAKKKMSKANIGKKRSDETKKKISKANAGENHYNFGKKRSDETKKKISKANISVDKETVRFARNDYNNGMKVKDIMIKYNIKQTITYNIINHKGAYKK